MSRPATSRLKMNPQLGSPPSLEFRTLGELQVDDSYQRSLDTEPSMRLIRKIAQFWDWSYCQPLVVARRQDGSLMVVDGQHRLAAARMRGDVAHLPCVITSYANTGDEAAAFVALNQNRKPLQPLDLFKAALAADDETATVVQRILASAGLTIAPHTNWPHWKPGMLANVNALQSVLRKDGEKVLFVALKALAIGFEGVQLRFAGTIFNGLAALALKRLNLREDSNTLSERLGAMLRQYEQQDWIKLARDEHALTSVKWKAAVLNVFERHYNRFVNETIAGQVQLVEPSKPKPQAAAAAVTDLKPAETAWCTQCDQRVSGAKVAGCASSFCSLKRKAA